MTKNPKRVAAGKKAWAKLSSAAKAARLRALGVHKKRSSPGGYKMAAKNKNGNGQGKQGIVSWITSVIALAMGLSNVLQRVSDAVKHATPGTKFAAFGEWMVSDYTGYSMSAKNFKAERMIRGWAPVMGGIAFKKGTSYLVKTARVRSLIPALRM